MANHYVSPSGSATWSASTSIDYPTSIATANANAVAGDTIILRGGTYYHYISPANSGTDISNRVIYQAYTGETPTFTTDEAGGRWSIKLQGRSWIKVDGIASYHSGAFFYIGYGSCYNELVNCAFSEDTNVVYSTGLITYRSTAYATGPGSSHNWIHDCTFSKYGYVTVAYDDGGTIRISDNGADPSSNNTFEDNVFSYGGHDLIDVGGWYNVVRNNIFHNEEAWYAYTPPEPPASPPANTPASGYFGNRCILLSNSGDNYGTANHTLVEGNRIGWAGTPPDDDGASGIENAGAHTLVRFNYIYGCFGMGYYSKMQPGGVYPSSLDSGSYARVYNNTIYKCGGTGPGTGQYEADLDFTTAVTIWSYSTYNDWPRDIVIKNNIVYSNYAEIEYGTANIIPQVTYENNYNSDPLFVAPTMTDKTSLTLPNLALAAGSSCIRAGTHLTLANGAGTSSTTLAVDDAYPFQDGTWGSILSDMRPDWIAIGTVTNVVEVAAVNYGTRVITLASPMTWADNAPIWLYKNSSGVRVLYGAAPEIGAYVYEGTGPTDTPLAVGAAALALASSVPTLSPGADYDLVVASAAHALTAEAVALATAEESPWSIRLGPLGYELTLPPPNWRIGSRPKLRIERRVHITRVDLDDGSVRHAYRTNAPRSWTFVWARLAAGDVLGIRNLAALNEPLHFLNRIESNAWTWVVIEEFSPVPIAASFATGTPLYRATLELREAL